MQYFLFTVNEQSWQEHISTGIAAINDPGHDSKNRQGNAQKQKALCEVAHINIGDLIFFYYQQEKRIMGLYEAVSNPFYDSTPLIEGGYIDYKFPIRVAFRQIRNFENDLDMREVWYSKDKGTFWSIQQQRGDSIGRHACISLTKKDGEHLLKMFYEKNPIIKNNININQKLYNNANLPFDFRCIGNKLHYEAVLQGRLLQDFRVGKHKNILGDYDYCVPFFPTSSQEEIDILLFKHDDTNVIWYEILELKQSTFTIEELNKLMRYEEWLIQSLSLNSRNVHSIAIAHEYNEDVKNYIRGRISYGGKKIRLIKYSFDKSNQSLVLEEESL